MGNRLYKSDIIDMENAGPLPSIHDNLDNLQLHMGESFTQLGNQTVTNGAGNVKKRKGDGDGNLKAFVKSESSGFAIFSSTDEA